MATTNSTIEKIAPMFTELLIKKIECLKTDWQKPWITSLEQGLPRNIRVVIRFQVCIFDILNTAQFI